MSIKETIRENCKEDEIEFKDNIFKLWFQWYSTKIDDPDLEYSGNLYVSYLSFLEGVNSTHKIEGRP